MSVAYIEFVSVDDSGTERTVVLPNPVVFTEPAEGGGHTIEVLSGPVRCRAAAGYSLEAFKSAIGRSVYGGPTAGNAVVTVGRDVK